jgi:hypothetical protein
MTKFGKILIFGVAVVIALVSVIVFAIDWKDTGVGKIDLKNKKDIVVNSENFIDQTLSAKDVKEMISSTSLNYNEVREWRNYTSEKLGISFKYPPNYIVMEKEGIRIFSNTSENLKNTDVEPRQSINLSKLVDGSFNEPVAEWYKENKFGKNADRDVYAQAYFMGMDSVAYQAEGLFMFDGVFFEKEGSLYQFGVQYFNSPESPKDTFYKIISTVEFR